MAARPSATALAEMDEAIRAYGDLAQRTFNQVADELPGATLDTVVFWVTCADGPAIQEPAVHTEHSPECKGYGLTVAREPSTGDPLDLFCLDRGPLHFSPEVEEFLKDLHDRYMLNV